MKKRILSIVTILCLLIAMLPALPITASATELYTDEYVHGIESGKTYCGLPLFTIDISEGIVVEVVYLYYDNLYKCTMVKEIGEEDGQYGFDAGDGLIELRIRVAYPNSNEDILIILQDITINDDHTDDDNNHVCDVCDERLTNKCKDENKDHICDVETCKAKLSDHSGGTATCKDKAVCEYCGEPYGELDNSNHTKALGDWQSNDDVHWKTYICCPTAKASEGKHTYEWKSENGQYWQKCTVCDHETAKKDIPEITINGADKVCATQDYAFSFTLPEGMNDAVYGYEFANKGDGGLELSFNNGTYSAVIPPEILASETSFQVWVSATTADGYTVIVTKTVTIQNEHTGGTANCTHKAKCEICGEEYGEINASNHTTLTHTEAKAATVDAEGNSEYWHCEECGKYFSDKDGKNEITLADTVIAKLPKTEDDGKTPQTRDSSYTALWFALLLISGGALVVTLADRKKKKRFIA